MGARSAWGKSQVSECWTDFILGNPGSFQAWGGERRQERLPAAQLNASGGRDAET